MSAAVVREATRSDSDPKQVVGISDVQSCANSDRRHVGAVVLADDSVVSADDAIALIDAGGVLAMTPPPGAPAHAAHLATGLDLLLQVIECPACGKRVLFA